MFVVFYKESNGKYYHFPNFFSAIKSLEDQVKAEKQKNNKLITDFESECLVLKNMVTVTESVMEDQKISLKNIIEEHVKTIDILHEEIKCLKDLADEDKKTLQDKIKEKDIAVSSLLKELSDVKEEKDMLIEKLESEKQELSQEIILLSQKISEMNNDIKKVTFEKHEVENLLESYKKGKHALQLLKR